MSILKLVWRNIQNNRFRSSAIFICILVISGLLVFTIVLTRGIHQSIQLGIDRLGADIIILPKESASSVQSAIFMGEIVDAWMPAENINRVRNIAGVMKASPQLYLASLANAPCCSSEMFIMAFDPNTDFTVLPWLEKKLSQTLNLDQAISGSKIFIPFGEEKIKIYGTEIELLAKMEPTGTGLDSTLFVTFETAFSVSIDSFTKAILALEIPEQSVSAILIKVEPDLDPRIVALQIMDEIPDVTAIPGQNLFQSFRENADQLRRILVIALSVFCGVILLCIFLIFSMEISQRKKEIGILRALGANRQTVLLCLSLEAIILMIAGVLTGVSLTYFGIFLFHNLISNSLGLAFLFPSWGDLILITFSGLGLVLVAVAFAIAYPVITISRIDPAFAMKD